MSYISAIFGIAMMFDNLLPDNSEKLEEIKIKYKECLLYPRKKKKKIKKQCIEDYNFYKSLESFNPFKY